MTDELRPPDPAGDLRLAREDDDGAIGDELDERLNRHNIEVTGFPFQGRVTFTVRDAIGALRAGIDGWVWADWLYIDSLWVDPDLRDAGWGGRLLHAAEEEGVRRGARRALVETFTFQARPFYERHGYRVIGEVPDYPPGESYYYLTKPLGGAVEGGSRRRRSAD